MGGWREHILVVLASGMLAGGAVVAFGSGRAPAGPSALAAVPREAVVHEGAGPAVDAVTSPEAEPLVETYVQQPVVRDEVGEAVVVDGRIPGWVADLHDDNVQWNGTEAYWRLVHLPPGRVPALEQALSSPDAQQRHFAAGVLRERIEGGQAAGCEAFWSLGVDELRGQDAILLPTLESTDTASLRFLARHVQPAVPALRRAVAGSDLQQRFFSAYLLGIAGDRPTATRAADELVRRLGDNDLGGDALMAAHGLYRIGAPALPTLREWSGYVDGQARSLIELIVLDITAPPRTLAELRARAAMHKVTGIYHDPAIEFELDRSVVPHPRR